ATLADAESGAAAVDFPALAAFGPASTDATAPFQASYSYSGSPAEPGTVTVHGRNGAGLDATSSLDVKADGTAPSGGSISYAGGYSATGSVAISVDAGTDGESGLALGGATSERSTAPLAYGGCGTYGSWDAVTSPDTLPDGVCARYRYRVSDRVGNETVYTSSSVVRYDSTPPTGPTLTLTESSPFEHVSGSTLFYNPQGSNAGSFTVHAATTDGESGIAHVDFPAVFGGDAQTVSSSPYDASYSWTAAAGASGAQAVEAWNGAGSSSSSSFTVTPDTTAPAGGSVDYPEGYATLPVTIATDPGSDSGSGLDAASAELEGRTAPLTGSGCGAWGAWHTVTSPDTPAEGTCAQYRYRVSDDVGNETVYASAHVVRADATAPTVSLDDPGANLRSAVTLTASADDTGAGVESVRFEIAPAGSGSWAPIDTDSSAPYTAALDTTSLADGLYDLRAVARDAAGNVTTSDPVAGRRVDNTPPAVSLGDPGSIVSGTVALSATADDLGGSGVASVRYEISPAGMATWSTVPTSWDTSGSGDGLYDVRAVATD
ncbi:MAG: hypothetical protein E6G42_09165, partial [Actinobacteria bacterium]